jgi:hypothetical protein
MGFKKPILVTGSHRSGSTWVGNMIALSPEVRYIDEPFNLKFKSSPFKFWFEYVNKENEEKFLSYLNNEIHLGPASLFWDIINIQKRQDIKPRIRKWKDQILNKRPLLKDPIAILSAEWLAKKYNADVLILIRHPAAFVNSIKNLGWKHNFSEFLKQPQLMNDYLSDFIDDINKFSKKEFPILDQAILLWKIFHTVILKYQQEHSEWMFLRYEDIAASPIPSFNKIYEKLKLGFNDNIVNKISFYSKLETQSLLFSHDPHTVRRNSKDNIIVWKTSLTEMEIKKIRDEVESVSFHFYKDHDW